MPPYVRKRLRTFRYNDLTYEAPLKRGERVTTIFSLINPMESCVPKETLDMFRNWDTFGVTDTGRQVPLRLKEQK